MNALSVLPGMMAQRSGVIANVTSMLGFMGSFGYAAYAGSKHALCGYTECLRQDLLPFGISVHLCYPPTTKTPGLDKENEIKPPEAWAIEGKSRAFTPEDVARALLHGIRRKRFHILVGTDSAFIWRMQRFAPWVVRWVTEVVTRAVAGASAGIILGIIAAPLFVMGAAGVGGVLLYRHYGKDDRRPRLTE